MANFDGANNGYTLRLEVTEVSYSIANNTSNVNWELKLIATSYNYFSSWSFPASVVINGDTVYSSDEYRSIPQRGTITIGSGSKTITHNADGKKTISCSASISATGASYMPGNINVSGELTLTTIPRASSITAIDANIESATTINISRASSSFTHTITWSFSDLSGTIATKTVETSLGWTIPSSFYAKIPNAKYGTVTLTCTTYNGNTNIGTSTTTFKATANEDICKPTISATVVDVNSQTTSLTQDNSKLVKYKSTARVTPTVTAKNSATISSITANGTTISGSYLDIQNIQSETIVVIATDSRGYTNSITLEPTIIQYIPITVNAKFKRLSPTSDKVTVEYNGNCFNNSFGAGGITNTFIVSYFYREKGTSSWSRGSTSLSLNITNNTYANTEVELDESFDYRKSYDFRLDVGDLLGLVSYIDTVSQGIPYYDYGIDSSSNNYFNVNGDIYSNNTPIVEQDTNYIKFYDGTMIYYDKETISTTINNTWGGLYISSNETLSSYPVAFINPPNVSFSVEGSHSAFVINASAGTVNNPPTINLCRGEISTASHDYIVSVIAIGKWK